MGNHDSLEREREREREMAKLEIPTLPPILEELGDGGGGRPVGPWEEEEPRERKKEYGKRLIRVELGLVEREEGRTRSPKTPQELGFFLPYKERRKLHGSAKAAAPIEKRIREREEKKRKKKEKRKKEEAACCSSKPSCGEILF